MKLPRIPHSWRAPLVYFGATALVLLALGISALRLLLTYAEDYRADAEREVSAYLKQPVRIGGMAAQLQVLSPTLVLRNVQLLDAGGRQVIAQFREIHVGLAPLASLRERRPVLAQVTLVGVSLGVERLADGSYQVQGLAPPDDGASDPEAVGRWLLAQQRIAVREGHLLWKDARSGRTIGFEEAALELRNDGGRHRLTGRVRPPAELGAELRFAADVQGDPFQPGGLNGEFHLAGRRLQPAGLLRLHPVQGVNAEAGNLSLEFWGTLNQSALGAAEARIDGEQLVFAGAGGRRETLTRLAGHFAWRRTAQGWRLDADEFVLARAGRRWEPSRWRVDLRQGGDTRERIYDLHADFLRIEDLAAIAALVPKGGEWQRRIADIGPRGELRDVRAGLGPAGAIRASLRFTDLVIQATARHPGAAGLDGTAWYADDAAGVRFETRGGQLNLHHLFRAPLHLKELAGELRARRDGDAWLLSSEGLEAANEDIRVRTALSLRLPDRGAPYLDLHGDFREGRAVSVPRYLPAHIMPADAVAWLDRAFKGGRVVQGGMVVRGPLDRFPFDHGEGRFEIRFDARDVELDYMPGWPRLNVVAGEVVFDGRSMRIESPAALLAGSRLSATTVRIPDLLHSRLLVSGHAQGELNQLFDYLRVTGLAGHFSEVLAQFRSAGPYALDLDFEQPLGDARSPASVRGRAEFAGNRLTVARGVEFTEVRGAVTFEDRDYRSERLTGRLFGAPVQLRVAPAETGDATRITLGGAVDAQALRGVADWAALARLQGRAAWDAQLIMAHAQEGESLLRLRSSLEGMALRLPAPLGKTAAERRELTAQMRFTGPRAGELELAFGDGLAASLALGGDGGIGRAAIHFGAAIPALPAEPGYVITGRLAEFSPSLWSGVLEEMRGPPRAKGARASAQEPPLPLRIDLEQLGIRTGEDTAGAAAAELRADPLPPMQVRVGALRVDDLELGALSFRALPQKRGTEFSELALEAPAFQIAGRGFWQAGRKPRTEAELRIKGKDLGAAARSVGIASVINKGKFEFNARVAWDGAPQDFDPASLDGSLQIKVKDGNLTEVKPGAGRLIGLLSLQALPQRLTLDFRDLFEKGVRFRTIEGTLNFKDGDAISDNLHMNALPAAVFVSGRTGLVRRDFDQTITVVPDVSGTLPVAGGLALGPQVGAALLLVQQIFHKKIDDATKFKYTVTGSWDQPVVKRVSKKR